MARMLRPQDLVVLLKLTSMEGVEQARQLDLALQLGLSQGEVNKALGRLTYAGLYVDALSPLNGGVAALRRRSLGRIHKSALLEVLLYGIRYIMPAQLGGETRGVATAWGAAPLAAEIVHRPDHVPVWPHSDGTSWGPAVEPLHGAAPYAALQDSKLHELLALVDAIRVGRARERALAQKYLTERLSA